MASRRRLGAAVLIDPPVAHELDGLRRGLSDTSLARIPAHVTLVPPVNVPPAAIGKALSALRAAAASAGGPLRLSLGPVSSFLPDNAVLILGVGGDLEALRRLRDDLFVPPLERPLSWPWVPHVTLAEEAPPARIDAALVALAGYVALVRVARVVLLEEVRSEGGRRWVELADAALERPAVVGRGGLALELTRSSLVDPEAAEVEGSEVVPRLGVPGVQAPLGARGSGSAPPERTRVPPLVITARREGEVVGVGAAWLDDGGGRLWIGVKPAFRRQGVGSHLLAHLESAARDAGWECQRFAALGPPGFYRERSVRAVPAER